MDGVPAEALRRRAAETSNDEGCRGGGRAADRDRPGDDRVNDAGGDCPECSARVLACARDARLCVRRFRGVEVMSDFLVATAHPLDRVAGQSFVQSLVLVWRDGEEAQNEREDDVRRTAQLGHVAAKVCRGRAGVKRS